MGMMMANRKSGGQQATTPDVSQLPVPGGPVPTPYPNKADAGNAAQAEKVKAEKGDETGGTKGVTSKKTSTPYLDAASKVPVSGGPAQQPGTQATPSQTKVIVGS